MRSVNRRWKQLAEWDGMVFLIAGGMLFVATANEALGAYTPLTTQTGVPLAVEALTGFGGLVLAIVGLVGLYPRFAEGSRRLARLGVGLIALPALVFGALTTCAIPAGVLGIPSPAAVIPAFDIVVTAGLLMVAVGAMVFGIAALRERTSPHVLGESLLMLGVAWVLLFGTAYLNGFPIAQRMVLVTGVLETLGLLGTGYALRLESGTTNRPRTLGGRATEE